MKELLKGFKKGMAAFFAATRFIRTHRLGHYFIYPFILSLLYWIVGYQAIQGLVDSIDLMIRGRLDIAPAVVEEGGLSFFWEIWETLKGWYNDGYTVIISILLKLAMFLLLWLVGKYILLALLSPVLALLSERCEEIITGKTYPFNFRQLIKDSLRGMAVALRNMFAEFGLLFALWILTFIIPLLAPFSAIISLLLGAFYYGFSMIDYVNERKKMSLSEGFRFIRAHRGLTMALGIGIALGMLVPFFGFIIASFTSIIGAVAAVIALHGNKQQTSELNTSYRSSIERLDS